MCVFGIMASGGGDFFARKRPTKRYFPDDYDYTHILQNFGNDESDIELPAEVADSEGEAVSDNDSGSEYRFSDDAMASDGDGDGDDDISSSSSSDDDFDVGYLEDVAAEQEQQRRGRLTTSTRRVFQGRVSALRIFCVLF